MKVCRVALLPLVCAVAMLAAACVPPPDDGGSATNVAPFAVATADPTSGQAPLPPLNPDPALAGRHGAA